jgi:hypothetical protein
MNEAVNVFFFIVILVFCKHIKSEDPTSMLDMLKLLVNKEDLNKMLTNMDSKSLDAAKAVVDSIMKTQKSQPKKNMKMLRDLTIKDYKKESTLPKMKTSDTVTKPNVISPPQIEYTTEVWSDEKKFLAGHERVFAITEFALHDEAKFTCNMKYFPVKFKLRIKHHTTNVTEENVYTAFLQPV